MTLEEALEEIDRLKKELETKDSIARSTLALARETTSLAAAWQERYSSLLARTEEKWNELRLVR